MQIEQEDEDCNCSLLIPALLVENNMELPFIEKVCFLLANVIKLSYGVTFYCKSLFSYL